MRLLFHSLLECVGVSARAGREGGLVRLKLDVQGQGGGKILDVYGQGGLEN